MRSPYHKPQSPIREGGVWAHWAWPACPFTSDLPPSFFILNLQRDLDGFALLPVFLFCAKEVEFAVAIGHCLSNLLNKKVFCLRGTTLTVGMGTKFGDSIQVC